MLAGRSRCSTNDAPGTDGLLAMGSCSTKRKCAVEETDVHRGYVRVGETTVFDGIDSVLHETRSRLLIWIEVVEAVAMKGVDSLRFLRRLEGFTSRGMELNRSTYVHLHFQNEIVYAIVRDSEVKAFLQSSAKRIDLWYGRACETSLRLTERTCRG